MTSSADPHRAYLMRALEILSDRERLVYDHMTSTREQSMTSGCTTDDNPVVPELMIRVIQSLRGVCIGINLDERSSINGDDPKAGVVDRELLTEAETYLETILTWRQAQGVVLASSENNPSSSAEMDSVVSRAWPSYLCGLDHEDHWVHFESLKDIDVQSLVHDLEPRDVIRCRIRLHEVLEHEKRARSMARKTCVYRHIYVLDLAGLKTAYFLPSVLAVLRPLFDIGQKYYPESLHRMYLVNAPWIFRGLWKIISPWIHPETRAKIQILVSDHNMTY